MQMTPVASNNIDSVGYDPQTLSLHVRFKSGLTYEFEDVPEREYDALISAPSVGSFFYHNIRDVYRYSVV